MLHKREGGLTFTLNLDLDTISQYVSSNLQEAEKMARGK